LSEVVWQHDVALLRRATFIVRLLFWRRHELPRYDANQNAQRLLLPFRC
jgi:hypothetical protein